MYWRWWWLRHARAFLFCSATRSTYLTHKHIKLDPHSSHFLARPLSAKPGAGCDCKQVFFYTPAPVAAFYIHTAAAATLAFVSSVFTFNSLSAEEMAVSFLCRRTIRARTGRLFFRQAFVAAARLSKAGHFLSRVNLIYWSDDRACRYATKHQTQ
jgi:hypothetical protein